MTAFEGGMTTVLVGLLFHLIISSVIASAFILSVKRIPLLRRCVIPVSLLYGLGVFVVMNKIVTPLSAAPRYRRQRCSGSSRRWWNTFIFVGLPLGILVQRCSDRDM